MHWRTVVVGLTLLNAIGQAACARSSACCPSSGWRGGLYRTMCRASPEPSDGGAADPRRVEIDASALLRDPAPLRQESVLGPELR